MSAPPRRKKGSSGDIPELVAGYERIHAWLTDFAVSPTVELAPDTARLISALPPPAKASAIEMRSMLQEVVSGRLRWASKNRNGSESNGDIAEAALAASGGGLTDIEAKQLRSSRLWPYIVLGTSSSPEQSKRPSDAPEQRQFDARPDPPWDLAPYDLSAGARDILEQASNLAGSGVRPVPVSSSILLLAIASLGRAGLDRQWVPDFLTDYLRPYAARFNDMRDRYLKSRGLRLGVRGKGAAYMSPNVRDSLDLAAVMAKRTTTNGVIGGRHLFAALMAETTSAAPPHAQARLTDVGVDLDALHRALYEWVRGWGDDDDAWRDLLLEAGPIQRRMTDIRADDTRGPNLLLDIERDVVALATIIAARSVSPPLSIGLFGDWGSGKTFFMRQLRDLVGALSRDARATPLMQCDLPFYKRIVQIEFNAWHYVEGNLWASLVEHIFENLHIPEEDRTTKVEDMQLHWIRELGFADAQKKEAQARHEEATERAARAKDAVEQAERDQATRKAELQALTARNALESFQLAGAGNVVRQLLAPLGLKTATDSAADIRAAIGEAKALTARGSSVGTALMNAPDRGRRTVWLLVILFGSAAVAALLGLLLRMLGQEGIAVISAAATTLAGWVTLGLTWARRQMAWVREAIKRVQEAEATYDAALKEKLAETQQAIESARQSLDEGRREIVDAKRELDAATRKEEDLKKELEKVTAANVLGQFVQDRASSSDYRKHLGVLALVRDDFEQLSELIEEENWRLSPGNSPLRSRKAIAGLTAPGRFASLEEEEKAAGADKRINRIVLYIDDLDRCPPAKVVEVLQAVHLLLAFPLFVVVVGVDARWISRSLESRYRELLKGGAKDDAADLTHMFGVARSEDYLEKIFQIPLWLRPMTTPDVQRMVRELTKPVATSHAGSADRRSSAPSATNGQANDPGRGELAHDTSGELPDGPGGMADRPDAVPEPRDSAPKPPNVESLEIAEHELAAMSRLAPLLGRSPRALKRFVNIYRLIKAAMLPEDYRAFVRPANDGAARFENLLFLLAVDTGLPRISRPLFDLLANPPQDDAEEELHAVDAGWLIERIDERLAEPPPPGRHVDPDVGKQWRVLRGWIETERARLDAVDLAGLREHMPRVAQFSFQAALERNAQPTN